DSLPYQDEEWGRRVRDDAGIFERLSLEAFQSGLSWLTILRKRENFRAAFHGFDPALVAAFGTGDTERLLGDSGIVRNRAKIEAVIGNARATLAVPRGLAPPGWPRWCGATRRRRPAHRPRRPTSRRGRRHPRRAPRNCGGSGSPSPARSRSTQPCRHVEWWTIISPAASGGVRIHEHPGRDVRP